MPTSLLPNLSDLAKHYGLTAIYVFGSQMAEAASFIQDQVDSLLNPEVDLDIGIQPLQERRLSAQERVQISLFLEDLFQVRRVDLVILPEAPPFLALDIIKGELVYCDDLDRQAEDELYVLRRAGDLAFYERKRREQIINGDMV
ncbi:MAG: hypothetical protein C0407_09150 [Desulfobacca sp.]|nr:hypothetical protein [Desulfobacca sp.]